MVDEEGFSIPPESRLNSILLSVFEWCACERFNALMNSLHYLPVLLLATGSLALTVHHVDHLSALYVHVHFLEIHWNIIALK